MPVLNDADMLYLGDVAVERAYLGEQEVWKAPPPLLPPSDPERLTPSIGIAGGITLVSGICAPIEGATLIVAAHCAYSGQSWTLAIDDAWGLTWTQVASEPATGAAPPDLCGSVIFVSSPVPAAPGPGTITLTCQTIARDSVHALQAEFFYVRSAGPVGAAGSVAATSVYPFTCELSKKPAKSSLVVGSIGNYNGGAVAFTPPERWTAFPTVRLSGYSWEQFSFLNGDAEQSNTWTDASAGADSIACIEIQGTPAPPNFLNFELPRDAPPRASLTHSKGTTHDAAT